MQQVTVYFISETAPVNTHASSVVFFRHLRHLQENGYRVIWVTDHHSCQIQKGGAVPWETIVLPNRKWHLPPYRGKGAAQWYRFNYYYRQYLKPGWKDGPVVLLTHISGQFLAPFAAFVQQRTGFPLISFFHDDVLELNFHRNQKLLTRNTVRVLDASTVVLTVSKAFAANWPRYASKFSVLYPLPEPCVLTRRPETGNEKIVIGYAGAVYDEIIPCFHQVLAALAGTSYQLVIIGDRAKTGPLRERYPETLTCIDLFETPAGAARYLADHCSAMIIPYPERIAEMPWIATCYPSKFIQYCQLGLPTIIIAPKASAIGTWCIEHEWALYSARYDAASLARLLHESAGEAVKAQIAALNTGEFRPGHIIQQFENILKNVLNPTAE